MKMNMIKNWQLRINKVFLGVFGIGLLPCPDCGLPLGLKIWPVAAVWWLFQRFSHRQVKKLDLIVQQASREDQADKG